VVGRNRMRLFGVLATVAAVAATSFGAVLAMKPSSNGQLVARLVAVMDRTRPTAAEEYNRLVTPDVCPFVTEKALQDLMHEWANGLKIEQHYQPDTKETDYWVMRSTSLFQSDHLTVTFGAAGACKARMNLSFL
jgi:hypothetical protein